MNRLLELLAPADYAAIKSHMATVQLRPGDVLAESGCELSKIYFPLSGIISNMVGLADGSLIQTFMVGRDGAIGAAQAFDLGTSINTIKVQAAGSALVVQRNRFREFADNCATIRQVLAAHEQFIIADIQQTAACNALHTVEQRMARWMLRMRDLVGDDIVLTHEQLAAMIGTRRSSVSTTAKRMQVDGSISYHRGGVKVEKGNALRRHACECHESVQNNYSTLFKMAWQL